MHSTQYRKAALHVLRLNFHPRLGTIAPADIILLTLCIAAAATSIVVFPGIAGIFGAGLAILMFAIARFDVRYFSIPNELSAAALLLGLGHAAVQSDARIVEAVALVLWRGGISALVFLALRAIYRSLRQREGLGLGDVKLASVAGVWLNWIMILVAIEIATGAALLAYLLLAIISKRPISLTKRIPFGFFLAPAIWLCWFIASLLPAFVIHL
jgi:leader peptidase (prepilin peptidase) / N-methyltransferase